MPKLTENERAATYIGWRAGQWCDHCEELGSPGKHAELKEKFNMGHNVPAPDMSDPRNYMKALEVAGRYLICSKETDPSWRVTITKTGLMVRGETPVDALAALYDAEHEDNRTENEKDMEERCAPWSSGRARWRGDEQ